MGTCVRICGIHTMEHSAHERHLRLWTCGAKSWLLTCRWGSEGVRDAVSDTKHARRDERTADLRTSIYPANRETRLPLSDRCDDRWTFPSSYHIIDRFSSTSSTQLSQLRIPRWKSWMGTIDNDTCIHIHTISSHGRHHDSTERPCWLSIDLWRSPRRWKDRGRETNAADAYWSINEKGPSTITEPNVRNSTTTQHIHPPPPQARDRPSGASGSLCTR